MNTMFPQIDYDEPSIKTWCPACGCGTIKDDESSTKLCMMQCGHFFHVSCAEEARGVSGTFCCVCSATYSKPPAHLFITFSDEVDAAPENSTKSDIAAYVSATTELARIESELSLRSRCVEKLKNMIFESEEIRGITLKAIQSNAQRCVGFESMIESRQAGIQQLLSDIAIDERQESITIVGAGLANVVSVLMKGTLASSAMDSLTKCCFDDDQWVTERVAALIAGEEKLRLEVVRLVKAKGQLFGLESNLKSEIFTLKEKRDKSKKRKIEKRTSHGSSRNCLPEPKDTQVPYRKDLEDDDLLSSALNRTRQFNFM